MRNMRTLIAVGAAGLGLGALGGYAANSTGGQGTTTTAADLKPKVHTKVIHHTKHVKPKHPVDAIGPPKNAGAPARAQRRLRPPPPPASAPPVSTASSGSTAPLDPVETGARAARARAQAPAPAFPSPAGRAAAQAQDPAVAGTDNAHTAAAVPDGATSGDEGEGGGGGEGGD